MDADLVGIVQGGPDHSHRRFDEVFAEFDPLQMMQGRQEADRAVTAHVEVADVVEENDSGGAVLASRRDNGRTDDDIGAARFVHRRRPVAVEFVAKAIQAIGQGAFPQVGQAVHDYAGRFASGVGVNDFEGFHRGSITEADRYVAMVILQLAAHLDRPARIR